MNTTVVFQSADYDGRFCEAIARKFLPDAKLIGWDFPDAKIPMPPSGPIYVLDLPPDCLDAPVDVINNQGRIVWIDHHKSAIDKFYYKIPGYRIDGVAACRLAWQWFAGEPPNFANRGGDHRTMPTKQDFIDRKVSEPFAVTLAGEYDVWCHEPSEHDDVRFQFGLDGQYGLNWEKLLEISPEGDSETMRIVRDGAAIQQCYAKRDGDVMRARSFLVDWEGLKFLALNTARCNSQTFVARDVPATGHDALLAFFWDGSGFTVSLYHAAHRTDLDLSLIAVKHGGGGHRGACGFSAKTLEFIK